MKTLLYSILIVFASCNGQKKPVTENENSADTPANNPFTLVISDDYSGLSEAESLIITDAKNLKAFFSRINRTRKPGLTVPDIDFSKEVVIITCSGEITSGDLPLKPYVLEETSSKIVLSTKPENTEKDLGATSVTSPFYLYTIPIHDKEIAFSKE